MNPDVSLWNVTFQCAGLCPDEGLDYYLEVKLGYNDIDPAIWGVTFLRKIDQGETDFLSNFEFQGGAGLLKAYAENEAFRQ